MKWATIAAKKRILASEQGAVIKDWGGRLPIALIYPNTYHVGMSSLALQTLYSMLNARPDVVCERVFHGYRQREHGSVPLSLETQRPLAEFFVLATTFSFELDYFNWVALLHGAGIPPLSAERDQDDPFLLAGGPAVSANPAPLAGLCDAIFIGEVEEILPRLLDALQDGLTGTRHQLLQQLAGVPGVYVPALQKADAAPQVHRQWVKDLNPYPTHTSVFTKSTEFGDMHLIEIARGCGRGCRFCLAGCLYRPPRERSAASLLEQARLGQSIRSKIGLVSAAVSDYSQIEELVSGLQEHGMQISVSSLRVDPLPDILLSALAASGARTLTVAPEAGSERLRSAIRKPIKDQDFLDAATAASSYHFAELKLYFMIGLPGEQDDDIAAITQLVEAVAKMFRGQVVASVAAFVPKAHTPFERESMAPIHVLRERIHTLRGSLRKIGVRTKADSIPWARVQAVLARGDQRLGPVLAGLPSPSLSDWQQALQKHGLEDEQYVRARGPDEQLPWDRIGMEAARRRVGDRKRA